MVYYLMLQPETWEGEEHHTLTRSVLSAGHIRGQWEAALPLS